MGNSYSSTVCCPCRGHEEPDVVQNLQVCMQFRRLEAFDDVKATVLFLFFNQPGIYILKKVGFTQDLNEPHSMCTE